MDYLFYIFGGIAVAGALTLILQRHPIYSALSLIVVLASLAVIYLLLGAEFMAALQVLVYAGAIMVVFVFVIMLLNAGQEEVSHKSLLTRSLGLPVLGIFFAQVVLVLITEFPDSTLSLGGNYPGGARSIGRLLFRDYVLPFEITSLLILIAILGAVVLARREN